MNGSRFPWRPSPWLITIPGGILGIVLGFVTDSAVVAAVVAGVVTFVVALRFILARQREHS